MASEISKAIPIINNFGLQAAQLLDARGSVATLDELNALLTDGIVAEGQVTYCEADTTLYVVKKDESTSELSWVAVPNETAMQEAIADAKIELIVNPATVPSGVTPEDLNALQIGADNYYYVPHTVTSTFTGNSVTTSAATNVTASTITCEIDSADSGNLIFNITSTSVAAPSHTHTATATGTVSSTLSE